MGGCVSKIQEDLYVRRFAPDRDQQSFTLSRRIERQLRNQEQEDRNMIKLLLLGSGNSGKSTVMKQFKIIHKRGFTTEERRVFRDALWKSAIDAMQNLVRARRDYISAAGLGDGSDQAEDSTGEAALVNSAMEPYFQFLLHRVRPDQPLYEEVIIPVAAETSPRAECFSPPSVTGSDKPREAASPLLTSMTVVLSSPPVTERKSPNIALDLSNQEGDQEHLLLPKSVMLNGDRVEEEDAGIPASIAEGEEGDETLSRATDNMQHGGQGTAEVVSIINKKLEDEDDNGSKASDASSHERAIPNDLSSHFDHLGQTIGDGNNTTRLLPEEDDEEDEAEATLSQVTKQNSLLSTVASSLPESLDQSNSSDRGGQDELLQEEQTKEQRKERRSRKMSFNSPEEEAEYLVRMERRKRKKKRKEKSKKRAAAAFATDESDAGLSVGRTGTKKVFSGSSVESFRSDLSRSNAMQKATSAPTVTWEKMTVAQLLQKVWMDPLIQRMYTLEEKSPQLEAPLGYIMDAMDRISELGFQPTNEDILFARKRTSGVNLLDFEAYGAKFLLIDVGGQRTERKKWLAHFDIVDAVIFVVGLDQYDQVMMEDGVTNRLRDSLELFEEMCSSPWFRSSSFLLFLNKSDVFKTKIKQVPLTVCFRGYQGDPHDYDQCSKYIIKRFQTIHSIHASAFRDSQQAHHRRGGAATQAMPHVYPYMTNATDTESMRFVIDTCQDILLRSEMAQWGFFDF